MQWSTGQWLDFSRDLLTAGFAACPWPYRLEHAGGAYRSSGCRFAHGRGSAVARCTRLLDRRGARSRRATRLERGALRRASWAGAQALKCWIRSAGLRLISRAFTSAVRSFWRAWGVCRALSPGCGALGQAGGALRLVESPLDIAQAMRTRLLAAPAEATDEDGLCLCSTPDGPGFSSATHRGRCRG